MLLDQSVSKEILETVTDSDDEAKIQLAWHIIKTLDEVDAGLVVEDPDLLSVEEIEDAREVLSQYDEALKKQKEFDEEEDFKYADELRVFRQQVEEIFESSDITLEERRYLTVEYIRKGEECFEDFSNHSSRIQTHFTGGNGKGKISQWMDKHGYVAPEAARNKRSAQYKWEAIARAWEYVKRRCKEVLDSWKPWIRSQAEEYEEKGVAHFVEQCNKTKEGKKVIQILEDNPDLLNLSEQQGIFWAWKKLTKTEETVSADVKSTTKFVQGLVYSLHDIKPATWKLFVKLPRDCISKLLSNRGSTGIKPISVQLLRNLAEAGLDGNEKITEKILLHVDKSGYFELGDQSPVAIIRACANEWNEVEAQEVLWREDIQPILDWAENTMPALDENQQVAPFEWFVERKDEWHEEGAETGYGGYRDSHKWGTLLESVSVGNYVAVALTDSEDLKTEGTVMSHCVNRYTKNCAKRGARIFSLRANEHEPESAVATVELRRRSGKWSINQVRGQGNTSVSEDIRQEAETLRDIYNQEWQNASEEERIESLRAEQI